jgi:repressor LexA
LREIGEEFGITSTNGVRYYLGVLEREGYLKRRGRISRGMEVAEIAVKRFSRLYGAEGFGEVEWPGIPILGRVAAGTPLLATENVEGTLNLNEIFHETAMMFALRIKGDSMKGAGILDGDIVVVRKDDRAESGDVVVAMLGEDATVKSLDLSQNSLKLVPANPDFEPIEVKEGDDFRILGVVLGLVRPPDGGKKAERRS